MDSEEVQPIKLTYLLAMLEDLVVKKVTLILGAMQIPEEGRPYVYVGKGKAEDDP